MAPREGSPPPAAARRLPVAEKSGLDQLAIFGGAPAFSEPLHVGRPSLGDRRRLLARLRDMLDRRWLTNNGPYVRELEAGLARLLGVQHCVAVCNGTVGLELAIRATGLAGEVVIPSFTFVATAHALTWHGITPVFCDVADRAPTLDPLAVERLITPRTTGIIGVHVWGRPCDVDALTSIARARGLVLLFDAAHALGCTYRGRPVGGFGRAEVFSFHATKFFNTFEGGAIATDDGDLAARLRLMRNFGFAGQDNVIALGINGKMSEASAAMGLTSLESLDRLIAVNRRNDGLYREGLRDCPGIRLLPYDPTERHNYQYVVVEIDEAVAGIGRDAGVVAFLDETQSLWGTTVLGVPVLGPPSAIGEARARGAEGGLVAIGSGAARERLAEGLVGQGLALVTLVHPRAHVAPSARLGRGVFVGALAGVSSGAAVDDLALIGPMAFVSHHVRVGRGASLSARATLGGRSSVGARAFLGLGAIVVPEVGVGDDAVVAAGTLVTRDVPAGANVAGVPARAIRP